MLALICKKKKKKKKKNFITHSWRLSQLSRLFSSLFFVKIAHPRARLYPSSCWFQTGNGISLSFYTGWQPKVTPGLNQQPRCIKSHLKVSIKRSNKGSGGGGYQWVSSSAVDAVVKTASHEYKGSRGDVPVCVGLAVRKAAVKRWHGDWAHYPKHVCHPVCKPDCDWEASRSSTRCSCWCVRTTNRRCSQRTI